LLLNALGGGVGFGGVLGVLAGSAAEVAAPDDSGSDMFFVGFCNGAHRCREQPVVYVEACGTRIARSTPALKEAPSAKSVPPATPKPTARQEIVVVDRLIS
jgi:hypothetical protein